MDHIQEKRASARDWTLRLAEDGVTSCQEHSRSRSERAAGQTGLNIIYAVRPSSDVALLPCRTKFRN